MPNLQKSLKSLKNPQKPSTLSGSLGLSPTVINVPNRLGFSYVRLLGNTNEVIQAYNSTVSATFDVPVTVQWDGTKYVVIGRDVNRYTSWGSSPYLPLHGVSHAFGGGDTTWILQEQIYPLRVYPSGSSLQIAPYVYNWLGNWKSGGNTGTSTITLPSDPTKQKVMLLYINGATSNPTWVPGTEAPINLTAKSDLIPYLPSFQMSLGIPLVMARIPSGTTSWTWDNIYDIRQIFGGFSSTSGSSTTGSSGISEAPIDGNTYGRKNAGWSIVSGSSGGYSLPTGSASILGGFKVGTGVYVNPDGTINSSGTNYSLPTGSATVLGGFRVGSGLSVSAGVLSATGGTVTGTWNQTLIETFNNLSAWTQVNGTWSAGSNILSKTDSGTGHLRLNSPYMYIGPCVMEAEFRCTAATVASFTHIGFLWSWEGTGDGAANCRLEFNTDQSRSIAFERAGQAGWNNIAIAGSWVQNTWYKLRVTWTGFVFQAYLDTVLVLASHPDSGLNYPIYVGLKIGDGGSSSAMQVRNFKIWTPALP